VRETEVTYFLVHPGQEKSGVKNFFMRKKGSGKAKKTMLKGVGAESEGRGLQNIP